MTNDEKIRKLLEANPSGLTITQLRMQSKLAHIEVKNALRTLPVEQRDNVYFIHGKKPNIEQIKAEIKQLKHEVEMQLKPEIKRNKPFTPNPLMGYQVAKGKVKIFLNRKATSKTLTLTVDDLEELVNAVKKVC